MNLPECAHCQFYSYNPYIVCAVHPKGLETDKCDDFSPNLNVDKEEEIWAPLGYFFYDGELIPIRPSRYTPEEQLYILDTHPFFTNICPNCSYEFKNSPSHDLVLHCSECGWTEQ